MIWINVIAVMVIWASIWSLIPRNEWWIRCADFPRLQILVLGLASLLCLIVWPTAWDSWRQIILAGLIAALIYQLKMVLPYTLVWKKQVKQVPASAWNPQQQLSIIVANVLMTNDQYHLLIKHVQQYQPDILLTLETNLLWQHQLQVLEVDYPYRVAVPLENLYGMHLYSRLPLQDIEIKFLLSDEIPSIHCSVILTSGQPVRIYALHPKPPSPTEAKNSTLRDAELLIIGDHIQDLDESCIVMGDLNDVAWSRTTRLFQRISGLLDPRIGRHYINTFHANYPLLRWSLDHVFHSVDFALIKMKRLTHIGSDHFPIYVELQTDRIFEQIQDELEMVEGDQKAVQDAIQSGIEQAKAEEKPILDSMVQQHEIEKKIQ
ncbi:endonuclease/exonuclease/phosphatase family protein [Acinetobacter rudis]|uniref:Endonuclease/exonuclease/phosphatase family protein n=1 Tax=Acinetobacter rudis TaxID=632955 RepID=A0AAW8JAQ9_9GAMM|nr:endonuclease/exonuclease/phosphatase family protein [Acinetobacter rudis]MDQ8936919.1 endonuclease/exonuclease/phosphatase family protein [Acinetobacter rudis]MDQ9019139.1 endonuclease/exonuclease/phosphatase family protein [Acinetobacter rudis]